MPRSNLVAYNINTGELTAFAPAVNGQVRSVAASPDKTRLYIGGTFTSVDGQTRNRIAAFERGDRAAGGELRAAGELRRVLGGGDELHGLRRR